MSQSVIHTPCNLPISEEQKKIIVDEWMRDFRSKGGKSRWKGHAPSPKERPDPAVVMAVRIATRRENKLRSSVVDGMSPWINGIRLVLGDKESLEARYTFHGRHYHAFFHTKEGFSQAWEQAHSWISEKRKEVKAQRQAKKKEKV